MIVWRLAAGVYAAAQVVGALNRSRAVAYRRGFVDGCAATVLGRVAA